MFSTIAVARRGCRRIFACRRFSRRVFRASSLMLALAVAWPGPLRAQETPAQPVALPSIAVTAGANTPRSQPPSAPSPVVTEPDVVVAPTTIPTPIAEVANSVTVITAHELEREQRRTLPDALATVPGLNVVQSGGPGELSSVFMRGANSNHVKVLIDGIDVTDPSNANQSFDFGQLLTGDIARIEVLRGPQSGLYGADAIGGVISITTKKGEGPPKAAVTMEAGSFGTFNQSGSLSGSQDRFNYAFNIQHWQTASMPVTPLDLLPPGQPRNNDFYDNKTYSTRMGYDFTDNFSVNVVARYTDARLRYTGDGDDNFNVAPDSTLSTSVMHDTYSRGEAVYSLLDGQFKNYFGLAYTNAWNQILNPQTGDNGIPPGFGPSTNIGERIKTDWRGVVSVARGETVVMGLEDEQYHLTQINPEFSSTPSAANSDKAAYVELQSELYKRVFLVSNVRYDDNASFGNRTTYRLAPAVLVPDIDTKLKASYGTGFKAPSLNQLFVNYVGFDFYANPNLKAETSVGYDYGFEQPLFGNRVRFGITYFHNNITNLIDSNANFTSWANIGLATTYGNESFLSWTVNDRLKLRADYTYTTAKDDLTGLDLLRRPKNKESVTANWTASDQLTLSGTVLHVGTWSDVSRDGFTTGLVGGPYTTVNLAANYKVNDQVTAFGRIDNLFDVHYQNPIGFERPGLGAFGGVRVTN